MSDLRIYEQAHRFEEKLYLLAVVLVCSNICADDAVSLGKLLCFNGM